jgi:hypothetical protein
VEYVAQVFNLCFHRLETGATLGLKAFTTGC